MTKEQREVLNYPLHQIMTHDLIITALLSFKRSLKSRQNDLKDPLLHPAEERAIKLEIEDIECLIAKFEYALSYKK